MLSSSLCILAALLPSANALVVGLKPAVAARAPSPKCDLLSELFGGAQKGFDAPVVMGTEEMMSQKQYGTVRGVVLR